MAGLVEQLQEEALDSTKPITDLLRKALVVAKKLAIKDFENWITAELNGYNAANLKPPEYRKVGGEIKAYNPYNNFDMPIVVQDAKVASVLQCRYLPFPISVLQGFLDDKTHKTDTLLLSFNREAEEFLCNGEEWLRPKLHISVKAIAAIVDNVRNTVLQWALKLEQEGIIGEGMSFSKKEKEKALTSTNIHIAGNFQGVFGNVNNSTVTQNLNMTVQKGDFKTLAKFLKSQGINKEDISELEKAVKSDPKPKSADTFGEKVGGWIGNMISKAATGAWDISVQVAGAILTKAISMYYGLPS
jgi:hypothetical protein